MSYWYNIRTREVAESEAPVWPAAERLGPFESQAAAENALLVADVRNLEADIRKEAEDRADEDEFDREQREWEEEWDK